MVLNPSGREESFPCNLKTGEVIYRFGGELKTQEDVYKRQLLCRCRYFEVYRMLVNTERCRELVDYQADSTSFRVLLCTDGCGSITFGEGGSLSFFRGDCIFVPADSVLMKIHGQAQFLDVRG